MIIDVCVVFVQIENYHRLKKEQLKTKPPEVSGSDKKGEVHAVRFAVSHAIFIAICYMHAYEC